MDDAAGGLRGLRPVPSTGLFDAFREAYGIDCPTDPIDLGGSSSSICSSAVGTIAVFVKGEMKMAQAPRVSMSSRQIGRASCRERV